MSSRNAPSPDPAAPAADTRAALVMVLMLGLVAGLGFAGYALHGGDVLTGLIEATMMWCM